MRRYGPLLSAARRGNDGFTLLEILVVLAILLTGLSALSTLTSSAMRQAVEAEEKTSIQVVCQNRLNRVLSGEETVTSNRSETIDGFEDWTMTVHTDPAPLSRLTRIRIVAQKFERRQEPSPDRPGVYIVSNVPITGQHLVLAQWARRDAIKIASVSANGNGQSASADRIGSLQTPGTEKIGFVGGVEVPGLAPDAFAAAGFETNRPRVVVPNGAESAPSGSETSAVVGDPLSESLLERARRRQRRDE